MKKIVIILVLILLAVFSGCSNKTQVELTTVEPTHTAAVTHTPTSDATPWPPVTMEKSAGDSSSTSSDESFFQMHGYTPTPMPVITPTPTPVPTINPEQADIYDVPSIELSVDEYDFWVTGDYVEIGADGYCHFVRLYAGDTELNIDTGYFGDLGAVLVIRIQDFPLNQLVNLTMEYYDENSYLIEKRIIPNVYIAGHIYYESDEILSLSDIGEITDIEHLVIADDVTGDIAELASLVNLKYLGIGGKDLTGDIKVVENFGELVYFRMNYEYNQCSIEGDIAAFENCQNLKSLVIVECPNIYGDSAKLEEMGVLVYIRIN